MQSTRTFDVVKVLSRITLSVLFKYRTYGAHNVPLEGPVLYACNHQSYLDPVVLGTSSPRYISYIAKKDLFEKPILSWLMPRLFVIPVDRGSADLAAVKAAIRVLKDGKLAFGIFPEGTRSTDGQLQEFKSGAAAIAMRTGATIVPVAVKGTGAAWGKGKSLKFFKPLSVEFGAPIPVTMAKVDEQSLELLTQQVRQAIVEMLERP